MEAEEDDRQSPTLFDCYLTVGDPADGKVEKIGVSVRHLAAHSSVFREMLVDSDLADPTGNNTHITDVTPEVFKLMMMHVYGGQLTTVSQEIAAELVKCADKYNIPSLVSKAAAFLTPKTVDQVFPALRCVAYITLPDVETRVQKIIQEQTDLVIDHIEFLKLDENCLEYITKQEELAVTEVDLWKALLKWGLVQGCEGPQLRQLLKKPLQHVRLLTFTQDEFCKEVMPTNVLKPEEIVDVLNAITNNQHLVCPSLCPSKTKRGFHNRDNLQDSENEWPTFNNFEKRVGTFIFPCEYYEDYTAVRKVQLPNNEWQKMSNFTLTVGVHDIEILTLNCTTRPTTSQSQNQNQPTYKLNCHIRVCKLTYNALCAEACHFNFEGFVVRNEILKIPLTKKGKNLVLKAKTCYYIELNFTELHPVYKTECYRFSPVTDTTFIERNCPHFTVKFKSPIHVTQITFNK